MIISSAVPTTNSLDVSISYDLMFLNIIFLVYIILNVNINVLNIFKDYNIEYEKKIERLSTFWCFTCNWMIYGTSLRDEM